MFFKDCLKRPFFKSEITTYLAVLVFTILGSINPVYADSTTTITDEVQQKVEHLKSGGQFDIAYEDGTKLTVVCDGATAASLNSTKKASVSNGGRGAGAPGTSCQTSFGWCWASPPGNLGDGCFCPNPYGTGTVRGKIR